MATILDMNWPSLTSYNWLLNNHCHIIAIDLDILDPNLLCLQGVHIKFLLFISFLSPGGVLDPVLYPTFGEFL